MLYYLHRLYRVEFLIYAADAKEDKGNCAYLRYYSSMCLKGVGITTKHLNQDSRPPGQKSNLESQEYESEVLATVLR
jgi:hypothetical protein